MKERALAVAEAGAALEVVQVGLAWQRCARARASRPWLAFALAFFRALALGWALVQGLAPARAAPPLAAQARAAVTAAIPAAQAAEAGRLAAAEAAEAVRRAAAEAPVAAR